MKGVGSQHNDWSYYASPSSNLSAFATPFSVTRSYSEVVSAPFVDSSQSADAVLPPTSFPAETQPHAFDLFMNPVTESTHSAKPYCYSGLLETCSAQLPHYNSFPYDQCSNNSTKSSIVDAQPYYPSYVPSPIHAPAPSLAHHWPGSTRFNVGDYANESPELVITGQGPVMWNQISALNYGDSMQVGFGGSFSSNQTVAGSEVEERMDQGCQDVKDSINGEDSHVIGWGKPYVPSSADADQSDGKSGQWGSGKPKPVEYSIGSVMAANSMSLETHDEDPLKVPDSGNCNLSYTGSYDKYLRQHDKPLTGPVTDLNIGNITTDGDLGKKIFYNLKEPYHRPNPVTAGRFDIGHLYMPLERNEPSSSKNAMFSDKNVSRDVVDYIFKEMHGFQDSPANLDNLSLRLSSSENVNPVERSFDGADRCNPAVDSPCWKGVPAVHFSCYEVSEALSSDYLHKNEKCLGSLIQEPQSFLVDTVNNVGKSCENSNKYQMQNENSHQETNLAGSPRTPENCKNSHQETNLAGSPRTPENCKFICGVNTVPVPFPLQSHPTCDSGLNFLNEITEMKANNVPSTKSVYGCESGFSHSQHHVGEIKVMFEKSHPSLTYGPYYGSNVNYSLDYGKSHVEDHNLYSTSSVVDGPTTLEKSAGKVSSPKLDVRMLVARLHNLSELLLMHLSDDSCELNEQDCNCLKDVISNLNTCVSKIDEPVTPLQECLSPHPGTSSCAGQSCKLQQNGSSEKHKVTQVGPESSEVEHDNQLVQDEKNRDFKSAIVVEKLSDSISRICDAEIKNEDNMTKAINRILSENFHDDGVESQGELYKNLWLEAEAALCSIQYKARYNRMKIEMDKHKKKGMEDQSSLCKSKSSATKVHTDPSTDSSVQDSAVLNATSLKDLSDFYLSVDINKPNALTPEGKNSQELDSIFIQNSTFPESDIKREAADDEASVMARFHVLKARGDKSCMNTFDVDELLDKTTNSPPGDSDSQNQVNLCQDPPITCENKDKAKANDIEASVLARFCILKSRFEDSSSMSSEDKLVDGFAGKGTDDTIDAIKASQGKSLDVDVNPSLHLSSYSTVDRSIKKELHVDLEDHEEIEPFGTNELLNQPSTCYSDGLSSDWEHVEKRSL